MNKEKEPVKNDNLVVTSVNMSFLDPSTSDISLDMNLVGSPSIVSNYINYMLNDNYTKTLVSNNIVITPNSGGNIVYKDNINPMQFIFLENKNQRNINFLFKEVSDEDSIKYFIDKNNGLTCLKSAASATISGYNYYQYIVRPAEIFIWLNKETLNLVFGKNQDKNSISLVLKSLLKFDIKNLKIYEPTQADYKYKEMLSKLKTILIRCFEIKELNNSTCFTFKTDTITSGTTSKTDAITSGTTSGTTSKTDAITSGTTNSFISYPDASSTIII